MSRTLAFAALSVLVGFAAAGCGGSKSPSVASLGTTTTGAATTTPAHASMAALAQCFTAHGFPASIGSGGGVGGGGNTLTFAGVTINGKPNPQSPQFQTAMQACRKYLPGGGPPALTPAQQAEHAKAMANFAACMRKHGVPDFPDPNGQGVFPPASIEKLDPNTSSMLSAFKVCAPLEGKGPGPKIAIGP